MLLMCCYLLSYRSLQRRHTRTHAQVQERLSEDLQRTQELLIHTHTHTHTHMHTHTHSGEGKAERGATADARTAFGTADRDGRATQGEQADETAHKAPR